MTRKLSRVSVLLPAGTIEAVAETAQLLERLGTRSSGTVINLEIDMDLDTFLELMNEPIFNNIGMTYSEPL